MPTTRRDLLSGFGAVGAGLLAGRAAAATSNGLLIRNAHIVSVDPRLGDIPNGSIHIRDGAIVAVGPGLSAPGATVIDATGMIAMPGLIDAHSHMWGAIIRNFAGEDPAKGYFPTAARYGAAMTPADMYAATRLSAAEAINAGTTTVHDWCHNARSREHALADLRALQESGLRGRWSMGWMQGQSNDVIADLPLLEALHREWAQHAPGGRVAMGMAWRGMVRTTPMPPSVYRPEFEAARRLGLPITVHAGSAATAVGEIAALAREGFLIEGVQIVHGLSATPAELALMKAGGVTLTCSPGTELRIGYGMTPVKAFIDSGIPLGLSTDTPALIGEQSMFGIMKLARLIANGKAENEFAVSARQALELGTMGGARSLGIDRITGSLTPSKRADLILVRTDQFNTAPTTNIEHLLVESTLPENVDTVIVDGRVLKRRGLLTQPAAPIVAGAQAAFKAVSARLAG